MTKATKRTIGVICLLWLGTLLLLFANYKTKVYLEQLRSHLPRHFCADTDLYGSLQWHQRRQ